MTDFASDAAAMALWRQRVENARLREALKRLGSENVMLRHQLAGNAKLLAAQAEELQTLQWVSNLRL